MRLSVQLVLSKPCHVIPGLAKVFPSPALWRFLRNKSLILMAFDGRPPLS